MNLDEGDSGAVIDRYYAAMAAGDIAAMRACCTSDARFWHSFDGVAHDLDAAAKSWAQLVQTFAEVGVKDARRTPLGDGRYLNQQLFLARRKTGEQMAWAVCLIIRVQGGLIARVDEYIDRTGVLALSSDEPVTPGLEPAAG